MTAEQIERFMGANLNNLGSSSRIFFKTKNTFVGIFIKGPDYFELKKKNSWRILSVSKIEEYRQSKDINLSRIFNGSEFLKLTSIS